MPISIIFILVGLVEVSNSQWQSQNSFLNYDQKFTQNTGSNAYIYSGNFLLPSSQTTANFITCTSPPTSYITLNQIYPSALNYYNYQFNDQDWISMDFYFQGTWSSEDVKFTLGSFSYPYTYKSPTTYTMSAGFCDTTRFEVKTVNFTLSLTQGTTSGQITFTSSNSNSGLVSIRNVYVSRLQCYPSCIKCTGPKYNQCTYCYYGIQTNNICPSCPQNQYYWKNIGCREICEIYSPLYQNGFCQSYPISQLDYGYITSPVTQTENLKWQQIYDPLHVDTTPTIITQYPYTYGVFKFNSGVYRYFNTLASYSFYTYLIGLKITIMLYNDIPINCGIQFKINNTYYGSIYRNTSGIQTHKFKISQTSTYGSYSTYSSNTRYELISYVDIPKYPFLFSAVGNYTDGTAGWGMSQVQTTSGYCSQYCTLCEVSFKCKTCQSGFYFYRDGSCISNCMSPYQRLSGSYCYDYDDETPYSEYLIQEYINQAADPGQYAQYTLISQNGLNFLKGSDIYFSYWQGYRVFGGPFVWAQAKFQRVHNIINPHHSVTIAFYILYGPSFPSDGKFIYTIESNAPVTKSSASSTNSYSDSSKSDKVYEKILHNTNTLTITWECFGPNNEPIKAYCGIQNYYIAVHNCQPYCLQCSDQSTCTLWNSTYDSNIVKFSQAECQNVKLVHHPVQLVHPNQIVKHVNQLIPNLNQDVLAQYINMKIQINVLIVLLSVINVQLSLTVQNAQLLIIDNYPMDNAIVLMDIIQLCQILNVSYVIQFCKTCIGPTSDECLTCNDITNIEKVGSTCRCPAGSYYQDATRNCLFCHSSCLTCFRTTIDGCLTCNSTLNRLLKGLKCVCAPGYYEQSNFCTNCPITEDPSLSECYKLCNNNQLIWHTITCSSCDTGFQLVSGECQPICGDLQIKGYEQCEDNNTLLNDLCYNCQFQCPAHCLTCDSLTTLPCPDVCGDGIISGVEECEDGNTIQYDGCFNCKYQCQPQCTKCIKGQCFECATGGWFIDPLITPWQCKVRCGDQLISGDEQCDDGNTSDTDGCKDCKYFCRIGCSSCDYTTNTCLSCALPGFVPKSYYCQNVCGDGLVVVDPNGFFQEQCDDGNTINYDGCSSSCQFQCQPTTICTSCVNNRCEICATGYYLSDKKVCIPICGDALIVVGEQCENSSILPYKGCNNCQAKCQSSCLNCSTSGLGCQQCKSGYNRIDNLCYSICGDKIITEDEQCDDGNLIIGDGCHLCQFNCQDSCLYCLQGICYDCQEGYQLIQSKCYSICGDGLQKNNEQCEFNTSLQIYQNCQSCKYICDLNCLLCQFGICYQCNDGYELSSNKQYCVNSLQYNLMIIENCLIQIGNICIQCEDYAYFEKAEQKCNLIVAPLSFCQYQLKLSPDLYCSYCFDYCTSCNENNCIDCQNGYYLDENFSCISFCGDGILAHDEQCEIFNKNCLSCMFDAPKLCELYFEDQCFECENGYIFNQYNNACESQCGDGIIVHDEDCEDNNYIEFDGCYYCQYSCSQYCINCLKGVCQQCDRHHLLRDGFCYGKQNEIDVFPECQFNLNGECLICEEDFQLNEYGDCVPKCSESCIHCYNGQCFECAEQYELYNDTCLLIQQCQIGLHLSQELQICQSSCGDGYVTGWEECDDQNMEQFDGCYQCKYECDDNCIECIYAECFLCSQEFNLVENKCLSKCEDTCLNCVQGVCQLCSSGYFLNEYFICVKIDCEYDFSCTSHCGNGIIEDMEQCDDQNLFNDDGCNNNCEQTCDVNCTSCIDGVCFECKEGWKLGLFFCDPICGDLIVVGNEECDDGNQSNFDGCFQCKYQCSQHCEICLNGICQSCQLNYQLDQLSNSCKPIQPLLTINEQPNCKILNNNKCIFCQHGYLDSFTNTCIIDYNMNKCSKNCKKCVLSKCLECEFGYYGNNCMPKCGDGIIVQEEECDDRSEFQLDTCLNCKFQCPQYCKSCAYGVCTNCISGFYLDIVSNSCNSVCGDKIRARDEVCDDGNELKYDGCYQCKYQCQMECLDCQFGKCTQCEPPLILVPSKSMCEERKSCKGLIGLYYDNYSNDCLPQCGDGIVVGLEQCEDQNNIPYDGCYECQYQCHKMCSNCQKGLCFECKNGYHLNGQQCITKCGDGIKIGDELCDDQNDVVRDGCTFCKVDPLYKCEEDQSLLTFCYRCQDNCEECIYNLDMVECKRCKTGYFLKDNTCNSCSEKCEECVNTPNNCTVCSTDGCTKCDNISGFYLDRKLKSCVTKCGDNILAGSEQCDDGNKIDKDGCNSRCEIEKEFICKESSCYVPPEKQIGLQYTNSTTASDFDLIFKDLKIDGVCEKLKIWIEEFQPNEFKYEVSIKEGENSKTQAKCEIKFNFFKTIMEYNLIHLIVPLKENITRVLEEETREIIITPRRLIYYNQDQKDQAQSVVAASSTLTFLLQLIGPLTIILGGFNFFWTILDILTWINNFYFLNVDYPLNVKLLFNQFQWGDVINIPDVFTLNSPDDPYYFEAPPKFTEKDVNPLFLNNIQLFSGLISLAILGYFISICIVSFLQSKYLQNNMKIHKIEIFSVSEMNKSLEMMSPQKSQMKQINLKSQKMPYIINHVYNEILWFKENFRAKLLQIIGLVFLDICLACVLQLQYKANEEYVIIKLNIVLAIIGVIFILIVFKMYSFVCSQHEILYESKMFQNYYSSLYEGIDTKKILARNYCYVNLMRKAFFIFFTVYFYQVPLLQTSLCCLICFLNLALILYQNPFESRSVLIQSSIPDFCIFIIIFITVLLAIHDVSNIFSFDQKYFIGWIILFFIGFSIFVQMIFLFQQFYSNLKERVIQLKDYLCKQPSKKI
ncbi:unnamed protein product (macronuclear) [Paramecium tetraurelia]|uniref:EGF-like domain-containing protein n=1 Tax=Paramecium tetraurelia TaxID=5888 RepID=A0CTT5_PARTE|nr:uncharacterized protein GSPATT00010436001 [Paramecium tetraurelia]CAK74202.1 unnamed protein product [Paramecium tetraurelia]|eukprot:XP_001441599.1 hypothetical protein (macronuclear) [Paramecium tetraurelia strain d4-2]